MGINTGGDGMLEHAHRRSGNVLRVNARHGFELGSEADVDPWSAEPCDPTAGRLCGSGRHFGAEAGHLYGLVHHQQSAGASTVGEDSVLVPRPQ